MNKQINPGRFLVLGFQGTTLDNDFKKIIEESPPAGYLLLADNYTSHSQLKSLINNLKSISGNNSLFLVDQEPGRVQRFKNGFPQSKSPSYYVGRHSQNEFVDWCSQTAEIMRDIGVNMNLVPVVDLWPANRSYPVLDDRSFGDDPEKVSEFATISIEEFKRFGIFTCAKHFPGLGSAGGDPHKIMATSDESLERFIEYHWMPFRTAVTAGVNCMMTTHLLCRALDSENCATYSPNIISHLRNTVGHKGPIISDDLYMAGARNNTPMGVAAVRSIAAGHNLLIISRDTRLQREAMEFIRKRFDEDDSFGKIAIANGRAIEKLFETR